MGGCDSAVTSDYLKALDQQDPQQDLRHALSNIEPLGLGFLTCSSSLCEIFRRNFSVQLPQGTPQSNPHVFVLKFEINPDGSSRRTNPRRLQTIFSVVIRGGPEHADLLLPAKEGRAYVFGPQVRIHAEK